MKFHTIICKEDEERLMDFACSINHLQDQAEKYDWGVRYIDSLKDLKKLMKFKDTVYELYRF